MRRIISRPCRAALPLALGVYSMLMPGGAERALVLTAAVLLARGLSLCAGGALRAAAGSVVRASRLRGNLLTAAIMAAAGGIISIILCMLPIPVLENIGMWCAAGGALVNISQVFADRMYSSEDYRSAAVYDVMIAALALVGLLISGTDPWLMAVLPGCGAAAGILLLAGLKNGSTMQKGFKVLKHVPGALLRGWVGQAAVTACMLSAPHTEPEIAAALLGIAIIEWCEPVFRRCEEEGYACSVGLSLTAAIWMALCIVVTCLDQNVPGWYSRAPFITRDMILAVPLCCALAIFTGQEIRSRQFAVMLPLCICVLPVYPEALGLDLGNYGLYIALGLCIVAVALTVPDMMALKRTARARKIQKKRR